MPANAQNDPAIAKLLTAGTVNLNRMVKYLSTWNGTDNVLELLQNSIKILIPLLHLRARLQQRVGFAKKDVSGVANRLSKLTPLISDSRMLFRFWGSLQILRWLMSLSRYPPATTKLATIERFQCYAMLAYYPLEHLFYLRVHDIIPPYIWVPWSWKPQLLHPGKLIKWSCRFLAVYLLLQFAHLHEDRNLLLKKERALVKASGKEAETERVELKKKWTALKIATISTACKFPTSLHWALDSGFFPNDFVGSLVALTASVITFQTGWASTADVPPSPPPAAVVKDEKLAESIEASVEFVDASS